jgi:hypothetical protein
MIFKLLNLKLLKQRELTEQERNSASASDSDAIEEDVSRANMRTMENVGLPY